MAERPTLETARLILRPFTLADAPEVQQLAGERDVASTTRYGLRSQAWQLTLMGILTLHLLSVPQAYGQQQRPFSKMLAPFLWRAVYVTTFLRDFYTTFMTFFPSSIILLGITRRTS